MVVPAPPVYSAFVGLPALNFAFGGGGGGGLGGGGGGGPPSGPQPPPAFDPFADAIGRLKSFHGSSRRDGALTLGRIGDPRAVPALNERLEHDFDKEVRVAAAWAIGEIADEGGAVALERAAIHDKRHEVRDAATIALKKLPKPGQHSPADPVGRPARALFQPGEGASADPRPSRGPRPGPESRRVEPAQFRGHPPAPAGSQAWRERPAGPRTAEQPRAEPQPVLSRASDPGGRSRMPDAEPSPDPAKAGFGLATATFVIVSSMIGVGVLTTSGHTVLKLGSNQLMLGLWAVGGIVALCGALTLAELSAALPKSGGEYVIFLEAYGRLPAFLAGWVSFQFGFSAPIAAAASAAASYLLAPFALSESVEAIARPVLGSLAILGFATVHASGQGRSVKLQGAVTVLELAFLVAFVVAGLVAGAGHVANLDDRPPIHRLACRSTSSSPSFTFPTATPAGMPPRTWRARSATRLGDSPGRSSWGRAW